MEIEHMEGQAGDALRGESPEAVVLRGHPGWFMDPATRRIFVGGGMITAAILAARVKQVGPVKFYERIPDQLPDVLRAGAEFAVA